MSRDKKSEPKLENQEDCKVPSLLDLPDWTLDCILELLSPQDLFILAQACTYLRYKCRSDDLWQKIINRKWGRVLGDVAYQEWQWHTTNINTERLLLQPNQSGSCGSFSGAWPFLCFHSYLENFRDLTSLLRNNCSKMSLFICLQSGRFWFPSQVYKKTQLFCYEALVRYDPETDTFQARSPTGGWRLIERNIPWDRLRLSPIETYPMGFYMSNCMNDLKPGDYIEIQRRRRKEVPYDWWFAVVGHLESCDENVNHCQCQHSDMLVVDFKQYHQQSPWRRSVLNRNMYEEQRASGLRWLGGIRKLYNEEEIQRWNNLSSS